jgi:hypothetical protein
MIVMVVVVSSSSKETRMGHENIFNKCEEFAEEIIMEEIGG